MKIASVFLFLIAFRKQNTTDINEVHLIMRMYQLHWTFSNERSGSGSMWKLKKQTRGDYQCILGHTDRCILLPGQHRRHCSCRHGLYSRRCLFRIYHHGIHCHICIWRNSKLWVSLWIKKNFKNHKEKLPRVPQFLTWIFHGPILHKPHWDMDLWSKHWFHFHICPRGIRQDTHKCSSWSRCSYR